MEKTATVEDVFGIVKKTLRTGDVYYHKILFDNGDQGELGKNHDNAVKIGDVITYTAEDGPYGLKFKQVFQQGGGGNRGSMSNGNAAPTSTRTVRNTNASFALSYAKDIAVANINKADKPLEMDALADKIISTANKFEEWLREKD